MTFDPMLALLGFCACLLCLILWKAHKAAGSFNVFDIVIVDGKFDRVAFAYILVLFVTTWIMINLEITRRMSEGYVGLYCTAWVGPLVAKMVFGKNEVSSASVTQQTETKSTTTITEPTK
jgi:hypothetical protein